MSECQQSAACVLRHLSLFPPIRREILLAGAVPKLAKLVESKNEHTRMHSQVTVVHAPGYSINIFHEHTAYNMNIQDIHTAYIIQHLTYST
jgi:hypothetical protein